MVSKSKQSSSTGRRRFPRILLFGGILAIWLLLQFIWFDSYSLIRHQEWKKEYEQLLDENGRLQAEIEQLQTLLQVAPSDEMIEKIAREQYGMRREGEIVYRVEE